MTEEIEISVVVPTYMEAENVELLLSRIEKALSGKSYEIIVVDDNSPDGTAEIVNNYKKKKENIRLILRKGKRGLGSAIIEGIKNAKGKYVAVIDADLQHPPEALPLMLNEAENKGYEIVIGSRYTRGGKIENWSIYRKIISIVAILITKILAPKTLHIKDPTSGFFLVRKEKLREIKIEGESGKILLEICIKLRKYRFKEIPICFSQRYKGKSKLTIRDFIIFILHINHISNYRCLKFVITTVCISFILFLSVIII